MKVLSLTVAEILLIHSIVIDETGGTHGLRDEALLQSAVRQIDQTFGGKDLYRTLFDKTAALFIGLVKNHPFLDGNKRTATVALGVLLEMNGYRLTATTKDLADWVEARASSKPDHPAVVLWIRKHSLKSN